MIYEGENTGETDEVGLCLRKGEVLHRETGGGC